MRGGGEPPAHLLGERLPGVAANEAQLELALLNLVTNALDAMPQGGVLTLAVDEAPHGVRIRVHDTGSGIAAEMLPRIFDPWVTTKPAGRGTGRKADLCRKAATNQDRRHFGLDRVRDPLHREAHGRCTARRRTDRGQELGQLLRGPAVEGGHAQLIASTTRVWLWKPDTPRVRAISPYV